MSPCIHSICSRLSTAVPPRRDSHLGQIEIITRINTDITSYAIIGYFDINFTDQTVAFSSKILTCHWPSAVTLVMCVYNSFIVVCGLLIFIIIINIIDIILKPYPSQSILLQYMTWQVSLPTPNAQIIPSEILFSPMARSQVP